jgi:hypothetical protein
MLLILIAYRNFLMNSELYWWQVLSDYLLVNVNVICMDNTWREKLELDPDDIDKSWGR